MVLISSQVWQQWHWETGDPFFPHTENAAVTFVPFHICYCCFQLQEFLSHLKLCLPQTLLQRAMQCTGCAQLLSLSNHIEKQSKVARGSQVWQTEGTGWTPPGLPEILLAARVHLDPAGPAQVKGHAHQARRLLTAGSSGLSKAIGFQPLCQQQAIYIASRSEHGSVPRNSSGLIQCFKPTTSQLYQVELNQLRVTTTTIL